MPYPKSMVAPMRKELTRLGAQELTTPEAVDTAFSAAEGDTVLLIINSVCGCAAGSARPAVAQAVQSEPPQPDHLVTVFAGQDLEATDHVRETYLPGIPPSSPFMALFRDGQPVYVVERKHIEGRKATAIAGDLANAFEAYCTDEAPPADAPTRPDVSSGGPSSTFQSLS